MPAFRRSFRRFRAWHADWPQSFYLVVLSALLATRYFRVHARNPLAPGFAAPAHAWFGWSDQGLYYRAARAWAAGNLDSASHHYPAGYALLGALFVPFFPDQPFFLVDVLCWTSALWLFAALAAALWPAAAGMRAVGGTVFFLATVMDRPAFYTWETPWTSTPSATLTLAALLAALRYSQAPRLRHAVAAAFLSGSVILFRPTDWAFAAGAVGLFLLATTWQHTDRRPLRQLIPATGLAFLAGPVLLAITHLATHGLTLGAYMQFSRMVGFEWRLLPLRFVTVLLNPRPLFPKGAGLAQVYWWILPGMAGIAACLIAEPRRRLQHALVGGGAVAFVCLYLCYRDLHPTGLFYFANQHYFKWTIPVFALYALALLQLVVWRRRYLAGSAGLMLMLAAGCWRPVLAVARDPSPVTVLPDGKGLYLPDGLRPLGIAYIARSGEDFNGLYLGNHTLDSDGGHFIANADFKVFPIPFGLMLVPLRPLPRQPSTLHLRTSITLDRAHPVLQARQRLVFGLPCFILPARSACAYRMILQPGS